MNKLILVFIILNINCSLIDFSVNEIINKIEHNINNPTVIRNHIKNIKNKNFNKIDDIKNHTPQFISDLIAHEFVKNNNNSFIILIWPTIQGQNINKINQIIKKHGQEYYQKYIWLKNNGPENFVEQVPSKIRVWGETYFPKSLRGKFPLDTRIATFHSKKIADKCKAEIRRLFKKGKFLKALPHSIHITDNQYESQIVSQMVFFENSLNIICSNLYDKFKKLSLQLKELIPLDYLKNENYCVAWRSTKPKIKTFYNCSNEEKEIIINPKKHFFVNGVKFIL